MTQNNWLFSPELSGEQQTISFWVKNENDTDQKINYPETLRRALLYYR